MGSKKIVDLIERIERFRDNINNYISMIVFRHRDYIIAQNVEIQMYEFGVDAKNMSFGSYAESTKKRKKAKGQKISNVTLRDTGEFHESIFVDIRDDEFELMTKNETHRWLRGRYGENILGLNDEFISKFAWEIVYPELLEIAIKVIYARS